MIEQIELKWNICLLDKKFDKTKFNCGVDEITQWLKQYAKQSHNSGLAKTYVATVNDNSNIVLGYYSLVSASIKPIRIEKFFTKKLPQYDLGAIKIARLGVDLSMQGKKLGKELLFHALHTCLMLSESVGVKVVLVDAINENAKKFYLKYNFIEFENDLSLFMPIDTIKQMFS